MYYVLGLGSNIAPHTNMVLMLDALLALAPTVHVGRVLATTPVGVVGNDFLNTAVAFDLNLDPPTLKATLNAIETRLGRDRSAPGSKTRSRPADLDLLFTLEPHVRVVAAALIPDEPYTRPMVLDLLAYLGLQTELEQPQLELGVPLELAGQPFGVVPTSLRRM